MYQPRISIITTTYNCVDTVEQCVSSVVRQTYPNIEYLVIDGGSTDETVAVLQRYAEHFSYWVSEPDKGIYDAMNKGVAHATGDFVYFLGADDCLFDDQTITRVAAALKPNMDIWLSGVMVVNEDNGLEHYSFNDTIRNLDTWDNNMTPHQGIFARKELLVRHPFDVSLRIIADQKWLIQSVHQDKVHLGYGDFPVAYYSAQGLSSTSGQAEWDQEERQLAEDTGVKVKQVPLSMPFMRKYMKGFTRSVGLYGYIKYVLDRYHRGWRKHHCSNAICRWCHRY